MNPGIMFTAFLLSVTLELFAAAKVSGTVTASFLQLTSQGLALSGLTLIFENMVLSSRFRNIDRIFRGLDKALSAHRITGILAFILIISHVVLLLLDKISRPAAVVIYLIPGMSNLPYAAGITSLWLMTVLVSVTLFINLPYHIWKKAHEWFSLVAVLGTYHGLAVASDISRFAPLKIWIIFLSGSTLMIYFYKKVLSGYFTPGYRYRIERTERKGDIIELYLLPLGRSMQFYPGQFAFIEVNDRKIGPEDHPFSVSSSPEDKYLRFSIKISGDYTLKLTEIKPGTTVKLQGPYGNMGELLYSPKNMVLVAGGIGITPFLSMLRTLAVKRLKKDVFVFYSTRKQADAVYDGELKKLSAEYGYCKYNPHFSSEKGRLTADYICREVPDYRKCVFLLCGPPLMMRSISDQLKELNIPGKKIISENFAFV